jgi:hypothetical protein
MSGGQYLLPGEAVALLAFLIGPPLLLALAAQTALLWRRGMLARQMRGRVAIATVVTVVATFTLSAALLLLSSGSLTRVFGVRDLWLGQLW